jgi:hypothetical protein
VKTNIVIRDLDSQTVLQENVYYHVVALYDGANVALYINGAFENSAGLTGSIMTTNHDLTIGQHLPDNSGYNYKGILDEIRIYDYPLSLNEIQILYDEFTDVHSRPESALPEQTRLLQSYPNPFNSVATIPYQLSRSGDVSIYIINLRGQRVRTLVNAYKSAGYYSAVWDGTDESGGMAASGIYLCQMVTGGYREIHRTILLK